MTYPVNRKTQNISKFYALSTLFRPTKISIKLHIIKVGMPIVYIKGSQVIISPQNCISFNEDRFVLAISADPENFQTKINNQVKLTNQTHWSFVKFEPPIQEILDLHLHSK